jgi:hypothetical protein
MMILETKNKIALIKMTQTKRAWVFYLEWYRCLLADAGFHVWEKQDIAH